MWAPKPVLAHWRQLREQQANAALSTAPTDKTTANH
jgi:hypothetical protein